MADAAGSSAPTWRADMAAAANAMPPSRRDMPRAPRPASPQATTRLLGRDPTLNEEAHAVRINVLNSSMQEARDARSTRFIMWAMTAVNVPQIVAAVVILALYWKVQMTCYRIHIWVLFQAIYLTLMLTVEWIVYKLNCGRTNRVIQLRERYMTHLMNFKYGLDLAGLFWFLVGNMWVITDGARCDDGSPIYQLGMWMIVIAYVKIFLPCIMLLALLPVLCFCLPCVIRLLGRLQDPMQGKGATKEDINRLPTRVFAPAMFPAEDSSCCICLNEYEPSHELRVLPCDHHFHKECLDEWLVVNATCPTCRKSIYGDDAEPRDSADMV